MHDIDRTQLELNPEAEYFEYEQYETESEYSGEVLREGGKQFVRLAANTVQKATAAAPSADPRAVAQSAVTQAVQALAPGLLQSAAGGLAAAAGNGGGGRSGRWLRRGNRIVLLGV